MFTPQAKSICVGLMPTWSGWLCVPYGENIFLMVTEGKGIKALFLHTFFLSFTMLKSPLFKSQTHTILSDSASEQINIPFVSAQLNFLDHWIVSTDRFFPLMSFGTLGLSPMAWSPYISLLLLCITLLYSLKDSHTNLLTLPSACQSCPCTGEFRFFCLQCPFFPRMLSPWHARKSDFTSSACPSHLSHIIYSNRMYNFSRPNLLLSVSVYTSTRCSKRSCFHPFVFIF